MSDVSVLQLQGGSALLRPGLRELGRSPASAASPTARRTKIWEISSTLHCSIIGTCLTAAELRRILVKLGDSDAKNATDHILHSHGVSIAGRDDFAGRLLHKAIDRRHETTIKQFARAQTSGDVRDLWRRSLKDGAISGAYWAALTHPATDRALVQEVFGEVHMLSHLVGSSNRVDIARLRGLEQDVGKRDEKIERQQARLEAAARERRGLLEQIERLRTELAEHSVQVDAAPPRAAEDVGALVAKLGAEKARSECLEDRLNDAQASLRALQNRVDESEGREIALQKELAALEQELSAASKTGNHDDVPGLSGRTLLYVGGRPGQVDKLRSIVAQRGGFLLAHDGGLENSAALLPGLVSQAELTFFPVDCVSHRAAEQVKKLCRDSHKTFIPLRTASVASFIAAIRGNGLLGTGASTPNSDQVGS